MEFTDKQLIFAKYLLNRIGFSNDVLINQYLNKLEAVHGRIRNYKFSNSKCFDELLSEIDLKKRFYQIKKKNIQNINTVTATDLSNFHFCPVSYSIEKSFYIEYPTNEDKRISGKELHENLRLVDRIYPSEKITHPERTYPKEFTNPKIEKIKNCKLIFAGHKNENHYFNNPTKSWKGQPDYIFRDPNGDFFAVEEKFKYLHNFDFPIDKELYNYIERIKNTFYNNHIVQLLSYINYIKDYNIKYGVLLYWYYDIDIDIPFVHDARIKVIKSENDQLLTETYESLINFISKKEMEFNINTNLSKCAACVVNKYCIHKTQLFNIVKFPYNKYDLKLKRVIFPEELKNKEKLANKKL